MAIPTIHDCEWTDDQGDELLAQRVVRSLPGGTTTDAIYLESRRAPSVVSSTIELNLSRQADHNWIGRSPGKPRASPCELASQDRSVGLRSTFLVRPAFRLLNRRLKNERLRLVFPVSVVISLSFWMPQSKNAVAFHRCAINSSIDNLKSRLIMKAFLRSSRGRRFVIALAVAAWTYR